MHAFHNAERVIRFERLIGLYHEETIQELFLPYRAFIQFWNTYYGTAHFIVTLVVFALLFWKRPGVFPRVAQQPGDHDRPGDRRLRPVPADAAAPARRAVRPSTAGRASRATCAATAARSGSSTRSPSTAARGRSTPRR